MYQLIQLKKTTPLFLVPFVLACFALSPQARAVCQEGCNPANFNTFLGEDALINNTTGVNNTATGFNALNSNTTGFGNTATGLDALFSNTTGTANTANGTLALVSNTTGSNNTANGVNALFSNTTGSFNTANGVQALFSNTTGGLNTANGVSALRSNTTGNSNTANGADALFSNTTGNFNTANGSSALSSNTTGNSNTATGFRALFSDTTGFFNTANGDSALFSNNSVFHNTADGFNALAFNTTGSVNTALGFAAGSNLTTGSNNIDIGNPGVAAESNTVRIGTQGTQTATYIAGIYQATVAKGVSVVIDSTGHLGTKGSSERFKENIKPMDKASEAVLALKPVSFHYKKELDPEGIPQFGLVAEQVEKVNPDLVARDDQGKVYTVRYEAVNAMLLNEFLKAHRQLEEQQKQIEALTAGLQKVSAQVEMSRPAPQVVNNP